MPMLPDTARLPDELVARLRGIRILESLNDETMHCLDGARYLSLAAGEVLLPQGAMTQNYWILLEGSVHVIQTKPDGREVTLHVIQQGDAFGEVALLANMLSIARLVAVLPCELLALDEDQFWSLMTACPNVRKAILGDMAVRMSKMQNTLFQQEKMAALGTMAAGLMHELNNPGTAAKRAASQLRENLMRMHTLSSKFARAPLTDDQKECLFALQDYALSAKEHVAMNSLEQSDAEEDLATWMEGAEIENGWKLAPSLVAMGMTSQHLECARSEFPSAVFADALNWVEALVSSMRLVGTVEESIGRVSELVMAVKSYAYEGRGQRQSLDINRSIHATLVILGHKIREKQIVLEKEFAADLPLLETDCQGLNQIWTNLLDNAVDAVGQNGRVGVKTWAETTQTATGPRTDLCIAIRDDGSGIPLESQQHIFDPFYTTKPAGKGTGLGLGIAYRIAEQFGGVIRFSSTPGDTEFVVRLPDTWVPA